MTNETTNKESVFTVSTEIKKLDGEEEEAEEEEGEECGGH